MPDLIIAQPTSPARTSAASAVEVSAVVPALNEAATIADVVRRLRADCAGVREVIVVDDGSTDGTAARAEAAGARVLRHPRPRGYGAAVKRGILAAEHPFILLFDGDAQHQARDVQRLLAAAADHDLVAGHRTRLFHSTAWRLPGKWLLRRLGSYLVRQPIPDLNCGLRVYRREVIRRYLRLCADGYSFTATSLLLMMHRGHRVTFVPVDVRPQSSRGRVTLRTGWDTLILLLRVATLLDPLRVFLPLSGGAVLLGAAWGVPYIAAGRGISVGALLLLLTGVLLFAVGLLSDQIAQLRQDGLRDADPAE
jgi:glycosyltransferase involved in cell wall biosynthesis